MSGSESAVAAPLPAQVEFEAADALMCTALEEVTNIRVALENAREVYETDGVFRYVMDDAELAGPALPSFDDSQAGRFLLFVEAMERIGEAIAAEANALKSATTAIYYGQHGGMSPKLRRAYRERLIAHHTDQAQYFADRLRKAQEDA